MDSPTQKPWLAIAILAVALLIWAGIFATGAFLELGADVPRHDYRKPLIVFGSMALFLTFWGVALWQLSRRRRK